MIDFNYRQKKKKKPILWQPHFPLCIYVNTPIIELINVLTITT